MLSKKAHLPLETAILLFAGTAMLIVGFLLLLMPGMDIPCYQNGIYGLLLVVFSLQTITMGKTLWRRSKVATADRRGLGACSSWHSSMLHP